MNILDSMFRIPKSEVEKYLYVQYTLRGRDEEFKLYVDDEETGTVAFPRSAAKFHKEFEDRTTLGRILDRRRHREFVARPHQEELITQTLEGLALHSGGVLVAPPGTGKTILGTEIAIRMGRSTCILVHKDFLAEQWEAAIEALSGAHTVGRVKQDRCDTGNDFDFVIASTQSITAPKREYPREFYESFGLLITDELHRYGSQVWHQSLMKFPARYRLGLTATADRYDGLWGIVSEHVGPIVAKLDIPAIPNKVYMVKLQTGIEDRQWRARWMNDNMQRAKLISILATHEGRNAVIIRNLLKAIAKQRRIMVISERLVQIDLLKDALLKEGVPKDSMGFFVGGKKKSQLADASEKPIIFSTYQMAKEGLDIEALDTLFLGTPQYDIRQTVGRILRDLKGKATPITVDFVDADIERLRGQAMGRIKMYKEIGCEIEGRI